MAKMGIAKIKRVRAPLGDLISKSVGVQFRLFTTSGSAVKSIGKQFRVGKRK